MKSIKLKETKTLEFKVDLSNSFLKTVSEFANFGTGVIKFGVDNDGFIIGIDDLEKKCLDITNKINDSISPNPNYKLKIDYKNKTIDLIVYEGLNKPYFYKSKAYKRNDTSTIEVDIIELQRLILEGRNMFYEEIETNEEDLSFEILKDKLKKEIGVDLSKDILKTLGLISDNNKYNNAAKILSDSNCLLGIEIIKFGNNINEIKERIAISNCSILKQYDLSYEIFKKNYSYELIDGQARKIINLIPLNAFREALANAIIHRVYDENINIRIMMFLDKVIITSPGGLPSGISKEEYLDGKISKLRNPMIANIFYRFKYIEKFGTGILRIKDLYKELNVKPDFKVYENSISVILPSINMKLSLTEDEKKIMDYLNEGYRASSKDLSNVTGFNKDKVLRTIKRLKEKDYIKISGVGKATKYYV